MTLREFALGAGTRLRHIPLSQRKSIAERLRKLIGDEAPALSGKVPPRMIRHDGEDLILHYRGSNKLAALKRPRRRHRTNEGMASWDLTWPAGRMTAKEKQGFLREAAGNRDRKDWAMFNTIGTSTNPQIAQHFRNNYNGGHIGVYATPIAKIPDRIRDGKIGFPGGPWTGGRGSKGDPLRNSWEQEISQPNGGNLIKVRQYKTIDDNELPIKTVRGQSISKRVRGLSARLRLRELARGDYAIPALGKMLRDRSLLEEFLTGKRGPKLGDLSVGKIYPGGKISALRPPKKSDFHISGWTKGQMLGTEPVGPQNARWRDALIEERIRGRKENFKKNRDSLSDVARNVPLGNFPPGLTAEETAWAQSARTAARNNAAKMLRKGRAGGDVYEDIDRKFFCRAKLRLREFSALRKRIRVKWHPDGSARMTIRDQHGGFNEIGRIETTDSSIVDWQKQKLATRGQIKHAWIDPKFRGMGLATKMYGEAMKQAPRGRLVSDNAQFDGGYAIWNRLQRNKGYKIRENPKADGAEDGFLSRDKRPLFIGRINPAARKQSNLSAKLRLRELAEKFHLPYSVAKKIVNGIKGRGISIVRMRNEPSNVGYRGWGDVPVAKIERGSNRKPFADLLHESGHVDAGHLDSKSNMGAELLKGAEGYYPRAHHESSDDILNAARSVLLREKQANRAAGKILKDSGASPEQVSAFANEQRKNFRTYRKSAWRHAVAGERIKNPSATESDVMGVLQRQAERHGTIPSDGALRSARESVQRQIRMNPINRGRDPIFHNESFGVDGSKSILPLTISEAKRIHKNTSKLWRVREFARNRGRESDPL